MLILLTLAVASFAVIHGQPGPGPFSGSLDDCLNELRDGSPPPDDHGPGCFIKCVSAASPSVDSCIRGVADETSISMLMQRIDAGVASCIQTQASSCSTTAQPPNSQFGMRMPPPPPGDNHMARILSAITDQNVRSAAQQCMNNCRPKRGPPMRRKRSPGARCLHPFCPCDVINSCMDTSSPDHQSLVSMMKAQCACIVSAGQQTSNPVCNNMAPPPNPCRDSGK